MMRAKLHLVFRVHISRSDQEYHKQGSEHSSRYLWWRTRVLFEIWAYQSGDVRHDPWKYLALPYRYCQFFQCFHQINFSFNFELGQVYFRNRWMNGVSENFAGFRILTQPALKLIYFWIRFRSEKRYSELRFAVVRTKFHSKWKKLLKLNTKFK